MAAPVTYTTTIEATKTIGEIQQILARAGAARIAVDYTDGEPSGLSFALDTDLGIRLFSLPVNVDAMLEKIIKEGRAGRLKGLPRGRWTRGQAARVAWRVMKMWIESQLAMIDTGMVALDEVMLPYLRLSSGDTAYQSYKENELLELVAGRQEWEGDRG